MEYVLYFAVISILIGFCYLFFITKSDVEYNQRQNEENKKAIDDLTKNF